MRLRPACVMRILGNGDSGSSPSGLAPQGLDQNLGDGEPIVAQARSRARARPCVGFGRRPKRKALALPGRHLRHDARHCVAGSKRARSGARPEGCTAARAERQEFASDLPRTSEWSSWRRPGGQPAIPVTGRERPAPAAAPCPRARRYAGSCDDRVPLLQSPPRRAPKRASATGDRPRTRRSASRTSPNRPKTVSDAAAGSRASITPLSPLSRR
jgi:hypothetical protein